MGRIHSTQLALGRRSLGVGTYDTINTIPANTLCKLLSVATFNPGGVGGHYYWRAAKGGATCVFHEVTLAGGTADYFACDIILEEGDELQLASVAGGDVDLSANGFFYTV